MSPRRPAHLAVPRHRPALRWVVAGTAVALVAVFSLGYALTGNSGNRASGLRHQAGNFRHRVHHKASTTTLASPRWEIAWGSAMAWHYGTGSDTTVRELATVAIGGSAVRVRISNLMGSSPLDIGAASVAQDQTEADIVPSTLHPVTFGGLPGTSIPVGSVAYSDPVTMTVTPLETLAISIFVSNADAVTVHPCCTTPDVSFATVNGAGNQVDAPNGSAFAYSSPWPRWVDAVDVLAMPGRDVGAGSIVVVGDSITDGFNATIRWTDILQKRIDMLPPAEQRAIVNEGITANTLTDTARNYSTVGGGPPGLDRLDQDALSQSGVSAVMVFLGTNDLFFGATSAQVIAGLEQAASEIHHAGLKAIGVTLLPRMAGTEPWSPTEQEYLEQINQWLLTSHAFDTVIDLATTFADMYNGQCNPTSIFPPYDSGDNLHPDNAGQIALADAFTGQELGLPSLPEYPPQVTVTPTPGCQGTMGIPAPGGSESSG
jgi:lysophospholipase L1-like esterase